MESIKFSFELRKKKEKSHIEFTSDELTENPNKILSLMKKEFIDLKSWFLIIVHLNKFIIKFFRCIFILFMIMKI